MNGVPLANGIPVANGIPQANGLALANGVAVANGLALANGLPLANVTGAETNALASVNGLPVANGVPVANSEVVVIIDENDIIANADGLAVVNGEYRSINLITGVKAGHHKIIPAAFLTKNFKVTADLGELSIDPKPASVTPVNAAKGYGAQDPSPLTTGSLVGFEADDNITATYTRTAGENVGNYTISATLLPANKLSNYNITYNTAVFNIIAGAITVKVNDTGVSEGTTPVFTFTVAPALKPGDVLTVTYVVKNLNGIIQTNLSTLVAGTYNVFPVTSNPNYTIILQPGTLVVNPTGNKARSIKPILECITVANPATNGGFGFVANYAYENANSTDVWIKAGGDDNKIILNGANADVSKLPSIFKAGGGRFTVPFDGNRITWYLASFERNKKTATTSEASSTSSRCPSGFIPAGANARVAQPAVVLTGKVYPNPVSQKTIVETGFAQDLQVTVRILDQVGREYNTFTSRKLSGARIEVDMSRLSKGNYFIKVVGKDETKIFKVIKL